MEWQAEELNRVSWHMLQTQEAAARRFSHEMHDELGQALTALKANLAAMTPEDLARRRLDSMRLLDEAIGKVRELSQLLHPVILDDFGIQAGLRWLADGFSERTRIEVECKTDIPGRFSDDTERHLFRITQEALTNIARHSGATRAWIRLTEAGDGISLTIEDNGCGFNPEKMRRPSLGMVGMRARARQIGGELTVGTSSTGGVKLEVRAPKKEADKDAAEEDTRVAG
jgi:signal transduction histidine kinase